MSRRRIYKESANGIARLDTVPGGESWLIERVQVVGVYTDVTFYDTYEGDEQLLDFSLTANRDVADLAAPIALDEGASLLAIFTGGDGLVSAQIDATTVENDGASGGVPVGSNPRRAQGGGW